MKYLVRLNGKNQETSEEIRGHGFCFVTPLSKPGVMLVMYILVREKLADSKNIVVKGEYAQ
jgi:hypothetical protein